MKFDKREMDPASKSINEILYRKALETYIHPDNYQDVLRPLSGDERLANQITIDIDDTNQVSQGDSYEDKINRRRSLDTFD
ncbi:unnamed protein product [Adineta steineri]|uniref:Uncharacterized protein n=1 Tax=Adineta steineri TaxID=433720 RepID=A0A819PII4_9BILA|nr:unnamed protein product [Adineta steineri]